MHVWLKQTLNLLIQDFQGQFRNFYRMNSLRIAIKVQFVQNAQNAIEDSITCTVTVIIINVLRQKSQLN